MMLKAVEPELDLPDLDVIAAVMGCRSVPGAEATVGYVADRLQVDPSRASRITAEVVEKGYLRRVASQADSRRIVLELTPKGATFAKRFHERKWEIMARGMKTWSEDEIVTFARLLRRFTHWANETRETQPWRERDKAEGE